MTDKFGELCKFYKDQGKPECTDEEFDKLKEWSIEVKSVKKVEPLINFTYVVFIVIAIIIILSIMLYYYNKPVVLESILSMNDPNNLNDGVELDIGDFDGGDIVEEY